MTEQEEKNARKRKSSIRMGIIFVIGLFLIIFVIPRIAKNTMVSEAENVLRTNQLTPIEKYGDYSTIYAQQDYIVERVDGTIDTVGVCSSNGNLIITITIDEKKDIPRKSLGL